MTRQLTRRDLLLGMTAIGAGGGTVLGHARSTPSDELETLHAVAEVIYPSTVTVERSFIEAAVRSRVPMWEGYFDEQNAALGQLETLTRRQSGRFFVALSRPERKRTLSRIGVRTAHPIPDGTPAERIRFFVVNDLLYALFSHPKGGDLVGCENPPGHQGGRAAYQRQGSP